MFRKIHHWLVWVLILVAACSCSAGERAFRDSGEGCISGYNPDHDYFPHKAVIEFAKNFSVEYHDAYKVVTIRRPTERIPDETFVLVQCGGPKPPLPATHSGATVIAVPIQSMFSASASHMPLLADLGHVDVLTGISQARFVTTEAVLERIRDGKVIEYAPNNVVDTELVISKAPEILMTTGGSQDSYAAIKKAGIAVVDNAEWQEDSILGRAEWVKFMALFLNEEEKAQQFFGEVRNRYRALKERTRAIPESQRPLVMTGLVNRGVFEIAGGRSYVSTLIADAGGRYVWRDNPSSGYASVSLESQLARAAEAEIWINGGDWKSLKAMLDEERRYEGFRAYREGRVWFYNRKVNADGAIDYFSRGTTRPDLILADLIKIFHPELGTDHEFVWYKQVPVE